MINYDLQSRLDVIDCHSTGKFYKYGMCIYSPKYECKYRCTTKTASGIELVFCEKWTKKGDQAK